MKKVLAGVLACVLLLTLTACGGASQDELDGMFARYNELKASFETCGSTLYNLGVTADSELGLAYSDWGDAIVGFANHINENANRMGQEDVDDMVAKIDAMLDTIEETQDELNAQIAAIDITGRWVYNDESGCHICFDCGEAYIYDADEALIEEGTYKQDGIFVEVRTDAGTYTGVTDGATILFGEGATAFTVSIESLSN